MVPLSDAVMAILDRVDEVVIRALFEDQSGTVSAL